MQNSDSQIVIVPKVLWLAMTSSQVMMAVMSVSQNPFDMGAIKSDLLETPQTQFFVGLAALNFILSWVIPKIILKTTTKSFEVSQGERSLFKVCFPAFIVRMALAESITLFGFVLSAQIKNAAILVPFISVAMLVTFLTFPTDLLFRSWVKK